MPPRFTLRPLPHSRFPLRGRVIAEKYGYWVSSTPALDVAKTHGAIERMKKTASADDAPQMLHFGFAIASFVFGLIISGLTGEPVFVILGGVLGVVIVAAGTRQGIDSSPTDSITSHLSRNPWQAWPCRVDGVNGNPDSPKKIVYLMSPDQQVVKAFETTMPRKAWMDLTDGMGILWVCGDLRYPIVMGTVLGTQVWQAKPARKSVVAPVATAVFTDVISGATTKAIETLLNP